MGFVTNGKRFTTETRRHGGKGEKKTLGRARSSTRSLEYSGIRARPKPSRLLRALCVSVVNDFKNASLANSFLALEIEPMSLANPTLSFRRS